MKQIDVDRASIEDLQLALGAAVAEAIEKQGGKVEFTKRAGLNRTTLYRLLRGENVSTEVLLRALRELGRRDLITQLIAPPEPSPLELRPASTKRRSRKARGPAPGSARSEEGVSPTLDLMKPTTRKHSLVNQLVLGRPPKDTDDA